MKQTVKIILLRCLWIGLGVLAMGLIFNWLSPGGIPLVAKYQTIIVQGESQKIPLFMKRRTATSQDTDCEVQLVSEIDTEKARRFFSEGGAVFIDTRDYKAYLDGHIAGAVLIPYGEFQNDPNLIGDLDRNARIITYCDGDDCQTSIDMAVHLSEIGFREVWFYFGGWKEWVKADLPIVKGGKP